MAALQVADRIVGWLQTEARAAGATGAVVGLSGGIDSAVVCGLCARAFPGRVLGLLMPCHSQEQDLVHARMVVEAFGARHQTIDLAPAFEALLGQYSPEGQGQPAWDLARANIKPRLRMTTLYFHANLQNYLVVGTGNRSEAYVGYFTKYGDGGVDLLPLAGLVKAQVRVLAAELGVPQPVIDKPPSAGLWEDQTDEGEMGLAYADLDSYLLTGQAPGPVHDRIEAMHARSEHKRRLPPKPPLD